MNEQYISRLAIAAGFAWSGVALLILLGWVVAIIAMEANWVVIGGMLAATGCALAAAAATLSIRRYLTRTCALIRNLHGIDSGESERLRVLR